MSEPVAVVPAATLLLLRDRPAFEVLMVQRHHQIDFAAGALVFPGGKAHGADADPRWAGLTLGWNETAEGERPLRIAALREAYEETGILLARVADGSAFRGHDLADARRSEIEANPGAFADLLAALGLRLDLSALTVFARWITPAMMPRRFDTWFFLAAAPPDQLARCDGHEAVDAEWIAPGEALRLGASGQRSVIFPTRMNLKLLAEAGGAADAIARARARHLVTVEPVMIEESGGRFLVIPAGAGYADVRTPASALP